MAISLGQAVVEIIPDTQGFGKDVEAQVRKETSNVGKKAGEEVGQNFSSGIGSALKGIGTAVAAAGVAKFASDSISAARDLNEQMSKTKVVFGASADAVLDFGKSAATSIGASRVEALTAASTFGNLLRSVGLSGKAAADMSIDMTQLAGDMASFNNVPVAEALDAIRSGLVGETEPLKKFAVNLNEATLKQEAMRLGLDTTGGTLDAAAKAQAAYSIIMKQTAIQQGDFERTSSSLANQQRILSARFQDAKADIGQALLPAMIQIVGVAQDLIPVLTSVGTAFANMGAAAVGVGGPVLDLIGGLAGTDIGIFAITAAASAVAISKVGSAAASAWKSVAAFSTSMTTAQAAMGGVGLALAAVVTIMAAVSESNRNAKARQEELAKAQLQAGDPAAVLADTYTKLAASSDKVAEAEANAAGQAGDTSEAWVRSRLAADDVLETLSRFGVSTKDVFAAVTGDTEGFRNIMEKLRPSMTATGQVIDTEMAKASDAVSRLRKDAGANIDVFGEKVRIALQTMADTDPAVKAQLDLATSQATATDEGEKWLEIGRAMAETNPAIAEGFRQAAEGGDATTAMMTEQTKEAAALEAARGRLATAGQKEAEQVADVAIQYGLSLDNAQRVVDAEHAGKEASDANTKAKKELADALDEARQAQENYLFSTGGAQVQIDDVTTATRDLTKSLIEGAEAAGRDSAAFEGNTDAAINNREALASVKERAQTVINGYDQLGYSSEQATAAQQTLAQSMYDSAIQAGATAAEADALRQGILNIPREHSTRVDVAEQGTAATNAKIDYAARDREATISVGLQAVGISDELLTAVRAGRLTYAASGAIIPARRGGSLAVIGEGGEDEAVVPMGRNFAANLARIVGSGPMAQVAALLQSQAGASATGANMPAIVVNISGTPPADSADARRLGRIVGESAAQVLAHRQLLTAIRVG